MTTQTTKAKVVVKGATQKKKARLSRALILPALIFSIVLTQIPFLVTIYFSTLEWNLLKPNEIKFAWFENYVAVFEKGDLLPATFATIGITSLAVVFSVILGLFLAVLLDRKFRGQTVARTLLITPFLLMPAAASLIWKHSMFDSNVGILSWLTETLGGTPIQWTTDLPFLVVVIMLTWQYTPFMMLILLAGLQSQTPEVLEAAAVDGSGSWKTFRWITLPHLRQYVEIAVLLGTIMLLQVFDPIAIITKGTGGTKTLSYLLYERAFVGLNVGEAAAYGVVLSLIHI